jgi:sugar lactone lactonase YvrE
MPYRIAMLSALALCLSFAANAQLSNPNGLAFDSAGNLWVTNGGFNQVLELNPMTGVILNTITRGLDNPTRLQFVGSDLYVLNTNGNNITEYDKLTKAGAHLVQTISNNAITKPLAFAVDTYGDVYVGDNFTNKVIALNIDGGLVETLTQDDQDFMFIAPGVLVIYGQDIYAGFGPNVGPNAVIRYNVGEFLTANPDEITVYNDDVNTGPTGVAFDQQGYIYIAEYTSNTAVKYAQGKGSGSKPKLVITGLNGPEGIALDSSGNIYITNSNLDNIAVYNSAGTLIRTLE